VKERKYNYHRNLPHIERSGRAHFITFATYLRWELPPPARDLVLKHCLHEIIGAIKGASAHSINKALKRSGTVWQDESFDHVVRHAESLEEKIRYIRDNPGRKGLVSKPEDYRWLWEES
jgi:hypothetical protein